MSEAMRQMLEQSGREGVARGEAVSDPFSDEADGPPLEHRGTGLMEPMVRTGAVPEETSRTSSSRTARCGPACRVVWEGSVR